MLPPVHVTAAFARTEKPATPPDEPLLDFEKSGAELMLDVGLLDAGSLDVASLHAAPSSAVATRSPVASLERWCVYIGASPWDRLK